MRKQVYELTPADLAEHPVWTFALDEEGEPGQDEATVRPLAVQGPVDAGMGMLVVRARFILNDGSKFIGYLTPTVPVPENLRKSVAASSLLSSMFVKDLGSVQPHIVTSGGQVGFWWGMSKQEVEPLYGLLGKNAAQTFPVAYRSDVELFGGPSVGTIPAFLHLESFNPRRVREIK